MASRRLRRNRWRHRCLRRWRRRFWRPGCRGGVPGSDSPMVALPWPRDMLGFPREKCWLTVDLWWFCWKKCWYNWAKCHGVLENASCWSMINCLTWKTTAFRGESCWFLDTAHEDHHRGKATLTTSHKDHCIVNRYINCDGSLAMTIIIINKRWAFPLWDNLLYPQTIIKQTIHLMRHQYRHLLTNHYQQSHKMYKPSLLNNGNHYEPSSRVTIISHQVSLSTITIIDQPLNRQPADSPPASHRSTDA